MTTNAVPSFVKTAMNKLSQEKLVSLLGGDDSFPWQDLPRTEAQLRKVFAIARNLGYTGREAIAEFDFLDMTRGEISDLIKKLEGTETEAYFDAVFNSGGDTQNKDKVEPQKQEHSKGNGTGNNDSPPWASEETYVPWSKISNQ